MDKLVSVIIPVYNSGEFLAETLQSIYNQTYNQVEAIIVDNASDEPKTLTLLDSVKTRNNTRVFRLNENNVSLARNYAARMAGGEFLLPLDADDLIDRDFISKAIKVFDEAPHTTVVSTGVRLFGRKNGILPLPEFSYPLLLARNLMVVSCMFRKAGFLDAGGYDKDFIHGFEDWEFWIRFLSEKSVVHRINEPLFHYRIRKGSRNHALSASQLNEARKMIWQKHSKLYADYFVDPKESFEYQLLVNSREYKVGKLLLRPFRKFRLMDI